MGRGLSELQKWMLTKARTNRLAEGIDPPEFYVLYARQTDGLERGSIEWRRALQRLRDIGCLVVRGVWTIDNPSTESYAAKLFRNGLAMFADSNNTDAFDQPENSLWPIGARSPIVGAMQYTYLRYPDKFCSDSFREEADAEAVAAALNADGIEAVVKTCEAQLADLYAWEPMAEFYGFAQHRKYLLGGPQQTHFGVGINKTEDGDDVAGKRIPSGKYFDPEVIGRQRYNSAKIAISKAFKRLHARKLAVWFSYPGTGSSIKLTTMGMLEAERLSANLSDDITKVSR